MTNSMSHGNRSRSASSKLSLRTRFVCVWTSFSTNFWSILYFLWEWVHPSIDHQYSHTDTEHMTPETLYTNQGRSLNSGSPVLLSVTPSRNVVIQVAWGSLSIAGWVSSSAQSVRCRDMGVFHRHYLLQRDPKECLYNLQPTSVCVLPMFVTLHVWISACTSKPLSWLTRVKLLVRRSWYVRSLTGVL